MFIVFCYMSINIGVLLKPTDNASMLWRRLDGARLPGYHGTNANLYHITSSGDDRPSQQWDQGEIGHNLE